MCTRVIVIVSICVFVWTHVHVCACVDTKECEWVDRGVCIPMYLIYIYPHCNYITPYGGCMDNNNKLPLSFLSLTSLTPLSLSWEGGGAILGSIPHPLSPGDQHSYINPSTNKHSFLRSKRLISYPRRGNDLDKNGRSFPWEGCIVSMMIEFIHLIPS